MIIMDLEWNRSFDKKVLDEILQIGAVRTDDDGKITDYFNVFIKPRVHRRFDRGARSLPELQASKDSDIFFPEAWRSFLSWLGEDRDFAFWGSGDFDACRQNCEFYRLTCIEPRKVYDYQAAFSHVLGFDGKQAALWRAVDYLNLPDIFEFHNALHDALYTALIGQWLGEDRLWIAPPKEPSMKAFCKIPFDEKKGIKVGPMEDADSVLDNRQARTPPCPHCGGVMWIRQWRTSDGCHFYSTASCRNHGKFIVRLTLSGSEAGVTGRVAIPPIDRELMQQYKTSDGEIHTCKASPGRKHHRPGRGRRRSRTKE